MYHDPRVATQDRRQKIVTDKCRPSAWMKLGSDRLMVRGAQRIESEGPPIAGR
jgi:hypothetical protein